MLSHVVAYDINRVNNTDITGSVLSHEVVYDIDGEIALVMYDVNGKNNCGIT